MNRDVVTSKQITVFKDDHRTPMDDVVVLEIPLTIYLNGEELITLLCTPQKLDRLTLGFLRSEGLLQSCDQVKTLRVDEERGLVEVELAGGKGLAEKLYGKRTITSGCGKGTMFYSALDTLRSNPVNSEVKFDRRQIWSLMRLMHKHSALYRATGGVHGAALVDHQRVLFFFEDIGRHNAVDKIVGECLIGGISLEDKALITTGRLSSEILLKSAKLSLPVLISRSAPTSLTVELAEQLNITVIGFARGLRMCVYTHPWRVL